MASSLDIWQIDRLKEECPDSVTAFIVPEGIGFGKESIMSWR